MAEANAVEYLKKHNKHLAYICGDKDNRTCSLAGKLADLGCATCMYKVGTMGKNTISDKAIIYYNEYGFFTDFNNKNDL